MRGSWEASVNPTFPNGREMWAPVGRTCYVMSLIRSNYLRSCGGIEILHPVYPVSRDIRLPLIHDFAAEIDFR